MRIVWAVTVAVAIGALATPAEASDFERILRYRTDITVHEDGTLTVVETIRVHAAGIRIKRGIYRDFVIRYEEILGLTALRKPERRLPTA